MEQLTATLERMVDHFAQFEMILSESEFAQTPNVWVKRVGKISLRGSQVLEI